MVGHTPTPWRVLYGSNGAHGDHTDRPYQIVGGKKGGAYKPITRWGTTFITPSLPEGQANAAFIVKAVNAHAALVDALQAARQQLVTLGGDLPSDPHEKIYGDAIHAAVLTVVDNALAKAEPA